MKWLSTLHIFTAATLAAIPVPSAKPEQAKPVPMAARASEDQPAALTVVVSEGAGSVDFVAVGWPSALRIRGEGRGLAGALTVKGNSVEGQISFALDSIDTGIGLRNKHLKEKYLETARFPAAHLSLTSIDITKLPTSRSFEPRDLPFDAILQLHGVDHSVHGLARIGRSGDRVQVAASLDLRTTDFGIAIPHYMGITVGEQVKVNVKFAGILSGVGASGAGQ